MALGYEGYIMLDGKYALGTGTSVPRTFTRIDSQSGYGGQINGGVNMGIGAPRAYDWGTNDGSVDFEMTEEMWRDVLKPWLAVRQTSKELYFSSRDGNVQQYDAFWSSISVSASEQSPVTGSVGFTAIERAAYSFGSTGWAGFMGNQGGVGLLCLLGTTFPTPLYEAPANVKPIPWWNTQVNLGGPKDFINWTLELSQDVVKIFACMKSSAPVEPQYLAVGPMTVTFSGSYMFTGETADVVNGSVKIASQTFTMTQMELQSVSDDVQTGDALVPLTAEYAVYGIS